MVVPIYKQWTANTIRIQIVEQDNIVQLLAFFEDFSHADAMNFQLKSMDVFEKSDKGGKASVRLVDCKFALPVEERRGEGKMGKEEGRLTGWAGMKRRFVCLDQIEYPGEHDDIVISFDSTESEYPSGRRQRTTAQLTAHSTRPLRRGTSFPNRRTQIHGPKENLTRALVPLSSTFPYRAPKFGIHYIYPFFCARAVALFSFALLAFTDMFLFARSRSLPCRLPFSFTVPYASVWTSDMLHHWASLLAGLRSLVASSALRRAMH